jgi:hypothetical protein
VSELLRPDDSRDALRKLGGLLLGVGVLMLLLRKSFVPQIDPYADGVRLIIWTIPAVLLYGGSLTQRETGGLRAWQTVYSVFGLIFVAGALLQLVDTLDEDPEASLNTAWVFAVVAALGFYAGAERGIRFQLLFGGIAAIIAWSALWDKLLSDGISANFGVYRGLLGILSIGLLCGALYLWREDPGDDAVDTATGPGGDRGLWRASELFTAAGISAVIACSLGISAVPTLNPLSTTQITPVETTLFWDVLLLVISLGLVGIGSRIGLRGPVYVGAIGLLLFLLIAGLDLDEGDGADPSSLGTWPIVLLVLGALGILLSGVKEASLGDRPKRLVEDLRRKASGNSPT